MMSDLARSIEAQECQGISKVGSTHRLRKCAPDSFETLLHIKGFAGGVPLNTETAAMNPRVGID